MLPPVNEFGCGVNQMQRVLVLQRLSRLMQYDLRMITRFEASEICNVIGSLPEEIRKASKVYYAWNWHYVDVYRSENHHVPNTRLENCRYLE